jgi:short-subunit dehydrogenase
MLGSRTNLGENGEKMKTRHTALITGATSGIGRAYAEEYAKMGYDLILTGRRKREIEEVSAQLRSRYRIGVQVVIAELSDEKDVTRLVAIAGKDPSIEVLINNAGFGARRRFSGDAIEESIKMVRVHDCAPMRLIRELFPRMLSRKSGTIINVASMAAFLPNPEGGLYAATKAFLHSLTESIFMEGASNGIKVQSLCPGFTYTDFHRKIGFKKKAKSKGLVRWMEAEDVARASIAALGRGTPLFVPGLMNRILLRIARMVPKRLYYRLAGGYSDRVLSGGI